VRGSERDYTDGALGRAIFLLSVPMVLEMCMESLFGVVDIFWVSRLGKSAMAAVALTESTLTLLFAVAMGLSMGTTAIVARRIGEKRPEEAALAAAQALIAGVAVSIPVGLAGAFAAPHILRFMGAEPEVIQTGAGFTRIIYGGCISIFLLFLLNAVFRGAGDASVAMRSLWLANGINIILNPLLIFGVGPFPAMGVEGSALGTTIGRGAGVLYQLYVLLAGTGRVRLTGAHLSFDGEVMRRLIGLSIGGIFQYLVPTGSWAFLARLAAVFGSTAVAGYGLAVRIIVFVILPSWGMSNAAATLVGQNLGAGKPQRAEQSAWHASQYAAAFLGLVGLAFLFAAPQVVRIFTQDEGVIRVASNTLRIFSAGNVFYAFGMVLTQAFNGAGDTQTPTKLNLVWYWAFQIPLAYVLSNFTGLQENGVFAAVPLAETGLALTSIWMFRRGRWKETKV
jgi:putative MATE family efflux protein